MDRCTQSIVVMPKDPSTRMSDDKRAHGVGGEGGIVELRFVSEPEPPSKESGREAKKLHGAQAGPAQRAASSTSHQHGFVVDRWLSETRRAAENAWGSFEVPAGSMKALRRLKQLPPKSTLETAKNMRNFKSEEIGNLVVRMVEAIIGDTQKSGRVYMGLSMGALNRRQMVISRGETPWMLLAEIVNDVNFAPPARIDCELDPTEHAGNLHQRLLEAEEKCNNILIEHYQKKLMEIEDKLSHLM
ncbi:Hypothetical Protein FCC1311_048762 [Hondaea fermentalgiana]|uniref:Uncharacterized protein n=1 Tax=Hondaea fermentalgiana TaxID=2315210 RepID=A0A2R5GDL6_9STRA|nr:Hypothetical Protein FCC1311_048762 [Hondaea fermentalgiana]|eukprot:GBG28655.1 Hypothetical Protein FCC1311_048762 [Hondaea fermentalgiana]